MPKARYIPGSGWSVPEDIQGSTAPVDWFSRVAVDPSGNVVVAWAQDDGPYISIWSNRFTPSGGWGAAGSIENSTGDATMREVAVDSAGNVIAVWEQFDGSGASTSIWSNRYTPSGGWGAAALLEWSAGSAIAPQVAMDPVGNATAIWLQEGQSGRDVLSSRYSVGEVWWNPISVLIENGPGDASEWTLSLAVGSNGSAFAVWGQEDGADMNIWSNRFTLSEGWGTAALIENNPGTALGCQVAVDSMGDAIAVWEQPSGNSPSMVWSNRYTPGNGWGSATVIQTASGYASSPQVAMDSNGNAVAVWYQWDGMDPLTAPSSSIWSNRFTPSMGWGTAERVDQGSGYATDPALAVDAKGEGVVVWQQSGEVMWASHLR